MFNSDLKHFTKRQQGMFNYMKIIKKIQNGDEFYSFYLLGVYCHYMNLKLLNVITVMPDFIYYYRII